jgi:prepilin-type N-terminal cleavage/methylation domain-containing protein
MTTRGFTLVELLTAMVLLAVLAALSIKVVDARRQAYLAVMQSDLRNLATAQEAFYQLTQTHPSGPRYANSLSELDFRPSPQVQVTMVGMKEGWSARVQHRIRTDFRCALFVGDIKALIQPFEPAIEEGVMECEPKSQKGGSKK